MRIELILSFAAMAAATYVSRALFTVTVSRIRIPPFWERYLSLIPYSVLTAMAAPYLLLPRGGGRISLASPWLISGAVTLAVSFRTRSPILSVACGIAVFTLLGGMFS